MNIEDRILLGAKELFYKFGIRSITMDDVAKHLAISKKTIYNYFRDKNEIVMKCCDHDLKDRECVFKHITDNSTDAIAQIMQLMKHMGSMFSQMNPNLFYDMQKYHPSVWRMFKDFKEKNVMEMIEQNLLRGIAQGLYRKDINIAVIARLRIEEVEMAMNPAIYPPDKFNLAQVHVVLMDHFLHGITTLKGHRLINKYKQIEEEE
jgi:TetR/AcrR family transcriptional regulator, cholesterol catabolism regulator